MIHIFHHNDADGYASAAVIIRESQKYIDEGGEIKTYSCEHSTPMDLSQINVHEDKVYIVDYSFTNPIDVKNVIKLAEKYDSTVGYFDQIVWIDHHASSQKLINEDQWLREIAKVGIVRPENVFAGCMLTWLYFHPPSGDITLAKLRTPDELRYYIHAECPIWIQYVDDHDKWAHKIEDSTNFVTGVTCTNGGLYNNFLSPDGSYATYHSKNAPGITKKFVKKGRVIEEYRKEDNASYIRNNAFVTTIVCDGIALKVMAANRRGNSMLFGEYFDKVDAVIVFTYNGDVWQYSIFSHASKPFPVEKVAEMYKEKYGITGGGHTHAAGWAAPVCIFNGDDSVSTEKIPFKKWVKTIEE